MAYLLVFIAALVSGVLVFWLTLRAGTTDAGETNDGDGFLPELSSDPTYAAGAATYVPVGSDRR